jgi:putative ABC transport system permease protein
MALALGSAFLPNGLDIKEAQQEYSQSQAANNGFFNMLRGFLGLGLIVGIAALGVIASRSVVERRQQIGVLRAIGFQRRMVRSTFLLESSLVAILGTLLGVGLGLALAQQLVASFGKDDSTIHLVVPWLQIGGIALLAYAASLLTTYLPAWQAARVYPAEALRYE